MDHVPPDVFGEDYLYFYEGWLDDELSDAQAELLWEILGLPRATRFSTCRAGTAGSRTGSPRTVPMRSLLLDAGFSSVDAVGHDGGPLTLESRRMIVIATR